MAAKEMFVKTKVKQLWNKFKVSNKYLLADELGKSVVL